VDVENTPPSEDGEAMRETAVNSSHGTVRHWFAVYTTCRHEKRVAQHLEQRQIEHFLPLYRTQHQWKDGSRVMVDLPLFPGYVFVRVDWSNRVSVLAVPGVVSMIGTAMRPAPLPDFEVEKLRAGLNPLRAEPHPLVTVGQRVRIKVGSLAGVEGVVIRKKGGIRVVLTLSLLMQSIAIEVEGEDVEFLETSFPHTLETKHKEKVLDQLQRPTLYQS
jgi:transcription termination/antitermination protein NusG